VDVEHGRSGLLRPAKRFPASPLRSPRSSSRYAAAKRLFPSIIKQTFRVGGHGHIASTAGLPRRQYRRAARGSADDRAFR